MYKYYNNLDDNEVEKLIELSEQVKFQKSEGHRRRVGVNGTNALSNYNVAKWFDWTHAKREQFRTNFPIPIQDKILQGWFLDIPRGTGFLDLMGYWVDKPFSGSMVATALRDQTIFIDKKEIAVTKGQQIGFSLRSLHEIKPSKDGQLWACIMFFGDHTELHD